MKHLFALFFIVFCIFRLNAQVDTSFWFVAPDISSSLGDAPIKIHFQTYSQASIVYMRQPANPTGISFTLAVPANTIVTVNLSASITAVENAPVNTVNNSGIYISAKENISVYYTIESPVNKEMVSLKGSRALGTDFYTPIPASNNIYTYAVPDGGIGFDVVATNTGVTTILITPRAASIGRAKNMTFARSLTVGQTFSVRDNNAVNPTEMAGSIISSDQPIAVTISGPIRTTPTSCPSYFADQITSSGNIGTDYVILKGQGTSDVAYMLAPLNATSFTVSGASGTSNWLINADETYSINVTDPVIYVKTDRPVYMMHITGYGCKLNGAQVTPAYCAGSYTTAFTRMSSDSLNLNIYTRSGYQNTFTLTSNNNPVPVPASNFSVVPGSNGELVAARIYFPPSLIPAGSHNVLSNSQDIFGLGVHNGSYLNGGGYAYTTEFATTAFVHANPLPTATICANTQFSLTGLVGGGPITGVWSLNGFGSLTGPNNQLNNNVYIPNPVDTNIRPVKIVLSSTGKCPNKTDTLRLTVKQPPIVTAGSNSIICANTPTVYLNGNVYGATNQGIWHVNSPGSGSFPQGVNSFTPTYLLSNADTALTQLQFVLTSTNNAGCNPESSTITVNIARPPIVISGTASPIVRCSNNATVFLSGVVSGSTTSTGLWQTNGTGVFIPNNQSLISNYVPSIFDVDNGGVWLKLTSTNNLQCLAVSDSVEVVFSQPANVLAGLDINTCANNPYAALAGVVSGTASSTGLWLGGNGTFSPSNTALTPTYVATAAEVTTGSVVLTFSSTNNGICLGNTDQVKINFKDKPVADFLVTPVCLMQNTLFKDNSTNVTGIGGEIIGWKWNFGATGAPVSINENPAYLYGLAGTYTAQLVVRSAYNCYDTVNKPVTIYSLPVSDFNLNRSCSGSAQLISFKDNSSVAAPDFIPATGYSWDFGGFGLSRDKDTSIVFPSSGVYNITHIVTSNTGCKSIVTKSVTISPRPEARFVYLNNSVRSLGATVNFRDTSLYSVSWSWDFGNGETSNLKYPETFYKDNGTYTVTLVVTDIFGCPSAYSSEIRIASIITDITKLIPNLITPNNDGKNDYWRLDFIQVFFPEAEIEIYNRWGERLFRSVGYANAWDGSYKGDALPVGAYFYIIRLNDKDNTPVFKGTVTLVK